MIAKDFIERQIETLTAVIAKIIFKKEINAHQEVKAEISNACKSLIGLDFNFIDSLPLPQLVSFFSITGTLDITKSLVAAKLFNLASDSGTDEENRAMKEKSLYMYNALLNSLSKSDEYGDLKNEINTDIEKINSELP